MSERDARQIAARFQEHTEAELWELIPANEALLRRTSRLMLSAPRDVFVGTADAVHRVTGRSV